MTFTCPRCSAAVDERFYGPCPQCRDELRTTLGSAGGVRTRSAYEPTMHVTPNAVALKDD